MSRLGLSVFDLDRTLIKGSSGFQFCRFLYKRGELSVFHLFYSVYCYLLFTFCGLTLKQLHDMVFQRVLVGKPLDIIEKQVEDFVKQRLPNILYKPAFDRLLKAQDSGHYTVILSNGPSFLVEAIAKFFKVNEWKASMYEVDTNRCFIRIRSLMMGRDKAKHIRILMKKLGIRKDKVTAYSDSILDLPFLLAAGRAVAVNPDRKLCQVSKKKSWGII